jgi:hypothetical protein
MLPCNITHTQTTLVEDGPKQVLLPRTQALLGFTYWLQRRDWMRLDNFRSNGACFSEGAREHKIGCSVKPVRKVIVLNRVNGASPLANGRSLSHKIIV